MCLLAFFVHVTTKAGKAYDNHLSKSPGIRRTFPILKAAIGHILRFNDVILPKIQSLFRGQV